MGKRKNIFLFNLFFIIIIILSSMNIIYSLGIFPIENSKEEQSLNNTILVFTIKCAVDSAINDNLTFKIESELYKDEELLSKKNYVECFIEKNNKAVFGTQITTKCEYDLFYHPTANKILFVNFISDPDTLKMNDPNNYVLGRNLTFIKHIDIMPHFEYVVAELKSIECIKNNYVFGIIGEIDKIFVSSFAFNLAINQNSSIEAKCQSPNIYFTKKTMINCTITILNNDPNFIAGINQGIELKDNYYKIINEEGQKILKIKIGNNKNKIELKNFSCNQEQDFNNINLSNSTTDDINNNKNEENLKIIEKISDKINNIDIENNNEKKNITDDKNKTYEEKNITEIKIKEANNIKNDSIDKYNETNNNTLTDNLGINNKEKNFTNFTNDNMTTTGNIEESINKINNIENNNTSLYNISTNNNITNITDINNTRFDEIEKNEEKGLKNVTNIESNITNITNDEMIQGNNITNLNKNNITNNSSYKNESKEENITNEIKNDEIIDINDKLKENNTYNNKTNQTESENNNNDTNDDKYNNYVKKWRPDFENRGINIFNNNKNRTEIEREEERQREWELKREEEKKRIKEEEEKRREEERKKREQEEMEKMIRERQEKERKEMAERERQEKERKEIAERERKEKEEQQRLQREREDNIRRENLRNRDNNYGSDNNNVNNENNQKDNNELINENNINVKLIHLQLRYSFGTLYYMFYSLTPIPKGHKIKINLSLSKYSNIGYEKTEDKFIILKTEQEIKKDDKNIIIEYIGYFECKNCRKIILKKYNIEGATIFNIPEESSDRDAIAYNKKNYLSINEVKNPLLYITENISNKNCMINLEGNFFNKNKFFSSKFELKLINIGNKNNITIFCGLNERTTFSCLIDQNINNYEYKLEHFIIDKKENIIIDNSIIVKNNIIYHVSCEIENNNKVEENKLKTNVKEDSKKKSKKKKILIGIICAIIFIFCLLSCCFYEKEPEYNYSSSSRGASISSRNYVGETSGLLNRRW